MLDHKIEDCALRRFRGQQTPDIRVSYPDPKRNGRTRSRRAATLGETLLRPGRGDAVRLLYRLHRCPKEGLRRTLRRPIKKGNSVQSLSRADGGLPSGRLYWGGQPLCCCAVGRRRCCSGVTSDTGIVVLVPTPLTSRLLATLLHVVAYLHRQ